jgi:UbiD family decarboxylase
MRDWIEFLEEKGELVHNNLEVDLRGEIAAISRKICETQGKAVIHENIKGYPGWRIFSDGLATRKRMALTLGIEEKGMVQKLAEILRTQKRISPIEVNDGPCKEVKIFEDDIDLTKLPVPFTGEYDIPPYITAGISNIKDPETGWQNSGIRRFQLKGKRKLCNLILSPQHEGIIFKKYIVQNKPMPIAIVVGADPLYYLISQMPAPDQIAEMDYWGIFAGEPLQVVKCETSDIYVPATAEMVIEGFIDPKERILEGPFSEFPGYYSGMNMCPVIDVKAITCRKDLYYQYMYMGVPPNEGHDMGCLMFEIGIYEQVKPLVPVIRDVAILSVWSFTTAISISKQERIKTPGLVKKVAMAAKGVRAGDIIKNLLIFDDDIDVHNTSQVLWGFSTRFQPEKDITVIPDTMGIHLDPSEHWSIYGSGHTSFAIFDCTEPPPPYDEGYRRGLALPSGDILKKVEDNWERYGF